MFPFDRSCRTRTTLFTTLYNTAKCLAQLLSPFSKDEITRRELVTPCRDCAQHDHQAGRGPRQFWHEILVHERPREASGRVRQKNSSGRHIMETLVADLDLHHNQAFDNLLGGHNIQVPRRILPNDGRSRHGIARLSCGSQHFHGGLGAQRHRHHHWSSTTVALLRRWHSRYREVLLITSNSRPHQPAKSRNPPYASLAAMFKTAIRHFDCVINRGC